MRVPGLVAVVLVMVCGCSPSVKAGGAGPGGLAGSPAVSFDVRRIDGHDDALARYRGSVVLMNLWATWCPPCREEMPALERLWRENRGRGLVVLGVDQGESSEVAARFARERGVTFPVLVDERQRYGGTYAAIGLPTTVIVGRDGTIVRGIDGAMTFEQMTAAVRPLLAGHS